MRYNIDMEMLGNDDIEVRGSTGEAEDIVAKDSTEPDASEASEEPKGRRKEDKKTPPARQGPELDMITRAARRLRGSGKRKFKR